MEITSLVAALASVTYISRLSFKIQMKDLSFFVSYNGFKIAWINPFAYILQLGKFGDLMSCSSNDIFKNAPSHVLILIMTSHI